MTRDECGTANFSRDTSTCADVHRDGKVFLVTPGNNDSRVSFPMADHYRCDNRFIRP